MRQRIIFVAAKDRKAVQKQAQKQRATLKRYLRELQELDIVPRSRKQHEARLRAAGMGK